MTVIGLAGYCAAAGFSTASVSRLPAIRRPKPAIMLFPSRWFFGPPRWQRVAVWAMRRSALGAAGLGRPRVALDLSAMHDAPAVRVEGIAPVHGAAVVPQNEVADAPDMLPGEFRAVD